MIDIVRLVLGDGHATWSPLDTLKATFLPIADKVEKAGRSAWRYRPPFSGEAIAACRAAGQVITAQRRTDDGGFVLLAKRVQQ